MKAMPMALMEDVGYMRCEVEHATHVKLNFPGPAGEIFLPVIQSGTRSGTGCWTWNGDVEKPTLKPSVLTQGCNDKSPTFFRCHTWVNDGQAQFLDDCSHELRGQTVDLLEITP